LNLRKHISLKAFNTFGIDVNAAEFIELFDIADLQEAIKLGKFINNHLVLGGGSNILLGGNYDGIVIKNNLKGIAILYESPDTVLIKSASGEMWHQFVMYCVDHNFGGVENLSLIPGTVGAAPIQNIGAYGVELIDCFESLTAIDVITGEEKIFTKAECEFGYRNSIFKTHYRGKYFITDVTFKLSKHPIIKINYGAIQEVLANSGITQPDIKDVSNAIIAIRSSKLPDPKILGNAGSFFKNPEISQGQYQQLLAVFANIPGYPTHNNLVKVPAGWLIEQCGWKGKRVGNTGAHKHQALVLVNYGDATGKEIMELAAAIQQSVIDKFGISISPEVNLIT